MLLNNLYTIKKIENAELIKVLLDINPQHPIFSGHFPGIPILPGVCMVQMVKELLEKELGQKVMLTNADNIKFLSMMNPNDNSEVEVEIKIKEKTESQVSFSALMNHSAKTMFKFSGRLQYTK